MEPEGPLVPPAFDVFQAALKLVETRFFAVGI